MPEPTGAHRAFESQRMGPPTKKAAKKAAVFVGGSSGTRTQDPLIKSQETGGNIMLNIALNVTP